MVRIGFGAVVLAIALTPANAAMADASRCGEVPFPPAIPNAGTMAQLPPADAENARHQAFEDVINWQKGLKTYRGCLTTLRNNDDRKITDDRNSGEKDDLDDIKTQQADEANLNDAYNRTVQTEQSIVGSYNAVTKAYCSRRDVDQSVCQQTK